MKLLQKNLYLNYLPSNKQSNMNLQELKQKNPAELILEAEKLGIENPSTLRKQEILILQVKYLEWLPEWTKVLKLV